MKKFSILTMFLFTLIFISACNNDSDPYQVSLEIVADTGIEIAVGDSNTTPKSLKWGVTITQQKINNYISENYESFNLTYVTTEDGKTFQTSGIDGKSQYLEIPIHFRSNNASQIRIQSFSIHSEEVLVKAAMSFINSKNVLINQGQTFEANIADTVRFSIQDGQNIYAFENPESSTNTILGQKNNVDMTNYNGAIDYYKIVADLMLDGIDSVTVVDTKTNASNLIILNMLNNQVEQSGKQYYGYIILRIWLEKWDLEAYNQISGENFNIQIRFFE
jgi:hypothetical protein